jgi:hypothetical protein
VRSDFFNGANFKRNIFQHRIALLVGELHVFEFDRAGKFFDPFGSGRIVDGFSLIEQEKNPFRRRHGGLHDIVLLRQVADRLVHALNVLEKRHQHAGFDGIAEHLKAAVPEQQTDGDRAEDFDDGEKHRVVANAL